MGVITEQLIWNICRRVMQYPEGYDKSIENVILHISRNENTFEIYVIVHVQLILKKMVYGRGSQIPGAKSSDGLFFSRWRLMFMCPL